MKKLAMYLSVTLLATVLSTLALASAAAANDLTYSFTLNGPQSAADPNTGNTILVTGSGSFDTADSGTVIGSGSFTILNRSGAVVNRGTWKATSFVSFDSFGGFSSGLQGGVLKIIVTLSPNAGTPMPGVSMVVTCRIKAPPNTGAEGIIIGSFTETLAGHTLFHLND